jgi:hypothetical protein
VQRGAALASPLVVLVLVLALVLALRVPGAGAVIRPASTIDGPSEDIVGFGGVAMAEDGTGGAVYLKRVEGVAHVFVSRFLSGHWLAPIRVDAEEPFAASWPRIGAANGGELVVVWATPFATEGGRPVDELLSARLGPGASLFGRAIVIDPSIGQATGLSPDLAMSATGQADVVYRAINESQQTGVPLLRQGDVIEEVRVAHFGSERWVGLGAVNHNLGVSMRPPTAANAPKIAIGPTGNGVVVWQEPEIEGVAHIWARRVFGTSLDYVMPVSATSIGGTPIADDADAPSVSISPLGQAEVAYRQGASPGSPLPGPRIFLNVLPDGEAANGSEFSGASVADSAVGGGLAATVGPPSIDVDEKQDLRLIYDDNGTPRVVEGSDLGLQGTVSLGPGFAGTELQSASVMNPAGGGVSAWPSADPHGSPAVAVREDFPGGAVQTALVSGGAGGQVSELSVGRSGLGDGVVGFLQGTLGNAAIVATQATAPPVASIVNAPKGWIRPSQAVVSWLPAGSADGPLSYQVVLDGHILPTPAGSQSLRIDPRRLASGSHALQVLATDRDGQETLSARSTLKIDRTPPAVRVARVAAGRGVSVRVSDAYSGLDTKAVSVSFGDGARVRGRAHYVHRYGHPGVYRIVVHVRDKLGVEGTVQRLVSVG